jgi:hypothetical protein
MRARRRPTINDAVAQGESPVMRQSMTFGTPGDPACERSSLHSLDRYTMKLKPFRMLLLKDDPEAKERIISAVYMTPTDCQLCVVGGSRLVFVRSRPL